MYRREGCARCHTLFDLPPEDGPAVLPGAPEEGLIGSRVGPDLGLEGHRRSDDWHMAHLYAPEIVVPGSRMPASRHLFRAGAAGEIAPSEDALRLVEYLQALGRTRRDVWAEFRSRDPGVPAPDRAGEGDRLERGKRLYAEHCVTCHGASGDGRGPAAPLLLFPPRDFTAGYYRFRSVRASEPPRDADLFRAITLGTGTGAAMPGFYFLPAEDRWSLVRRIKEFSQAARGAPLQVAAGEETASPKGSWEYDTEAVEGRSIWDRFECAACHGPEGKGLTRDQAGARWSDPAGVAVPRSGDLTHACSRRGGGSIEAFARALRFGVGSPMPSFAEDLDDPVRAARSLLRHLESARAGPEPPR